MVWRAYSQIQSIGVGEPQIAVDTSCWRELGAEMASSTGERVRESLGPVD